MRDLSRGVYILPNLFTSASLFMGFFAIVNAVEITLSGGQNYKWCAMAIIVAAFFDMMDGRVARKTNTASRFGLEYDSLSDLVSFGAAPALVMYLWTLRELGRVGWLAAFLYMACGALRLARFNLQATGIEKKFFQGLPIPMAAMMLAGSMMIWGGRDLDDTAFVAGADMRYGLLGLTYLLAGLMVSSIPYRSFKTLSLTTRHPFSYLVVVVVGLMIWAYEPWWVIYALGCGYLLSGPVERYVLPRPVKAIRHVQKQRRMKRALERMDELTTQTPATPDLSEESNDNVHSIRRS